VQSKLNKYGFKRSHIPEVTGSSPVGPTNDYKGLGSLPNPIFCTIMRGSSQGFEGKKGGNTEICLDLFIELSYLNSMVFWIHRLKNNP